VSKEAAECGVPNFDLIEFYNLWQMRGTFANNILYTFEDFLNLFYKDEDSINWYCGILALVVFKTRELTSVDGGNSFKYKGG